MMKNEVHKITDQEDPWGVLELFEDLMNEADEIVKKYKKGENKNEQSSNDKRRAF